MTSPAPFEFVDGKHWADVLGCDMRAGLGEVGRVASRRSDEAMAKLCGEALSARLLEIGAAVEVATRLKAGGRRAAKKARGEL